MFFYVLINMRYLLSLFWVFFVVQASFAQEHFTDQQSPASKGIEYLDNQLSEQVAKQLSKIDWGNVPHKTTSGTTLYTVPVVVHVVHNYGAELVPDVAVYKLIDTVTSYFLKTNPDTINIIDKYKQLAANTQIAFKLATKAPDGTPTKGIDHIFSYLTYNSADQAKLNQWPQARYLNIWIVNSINGSTAAYAYKPAPAAYYPYYDGILFTSNFYPLFATGYRARYFAKYLNLPTPCGETCIDGDLIADTPPCGGTINGSGLFNCANLYEPNCDTPNVQNVMTNDGDCGVMFTYGQGQYMQYILQIDIGNRDSLIGNYNYLATGMNDPMPDLPPVVDFATRGILPPLPARFFGMGVPVRFTNYSWNDTIVSVSWHFSNAADSASSTALYALTNRFRQPGWATVSLSATGNNTGTTTLTDPHAIYIADTTGIPATGYVQDFDAGPGMDKWPIFNYYNNIFQWRLMDFGFGHSYLQYTGYDDRPFPENMTGSPQGDYDDIFTPAFDFSGFSDSCYLNFVTSGASIAANVYYRNDTLEIGYSKDKGQHWLVLKRITGNQLCNKGRVTSPYIPLSPSDWVNHSIAIPSTIRTAGTFFRLRYRPGSDSIQRSNSNYFYLDHFNFSNIPVAEAVNDPAEYGMGITIQPNPTAGDAAVFIKQTTPVGSVTMMVSDISGRMVYSVNDAFSSNAGSIAIPAAAIKTKGLYLVHIVTDKANETAKLLTY